MTQITAIRTTATAAFIALGLGLSACGSDTLDTGSETSSEPTVEATSESMVEVDQELADRVPEAIKKSGKLIDGSDGSYAPMEFIDEDGETMVGADVDLLNAVATTLGLEVEYNNAAFDSIILGVTSGKYDVGISSFTINDERKKQVNMIQYFSAGTSWAAAPGVDFDPDNACGRTIGVQRGTVQVDDLEARSDQCEKDGKEPIQLVVEQEQSKVTASTIAGKVDGMAADSPIVAYAVQQNQGQLEVVGEVYDTAPYGIVVDKEQTEMAELISDALTKLKEDGTYDDILAKWELSNGSVDEFPVNP